MEKEIIILNKLVKILLTKTECGINVLIAGGDFAHIGAVSIVDPQGEIFTKIFEGHKDHVMARNMGHEGVLASSIVMLTTFFSGFTLTFWLYLLRSMGLI